MITKKPPVVQFAPHPITADLSKYSGVAVGYVRESKLYASHAKKNQQRASKGLAQQEVSIETQITSLKELAAKHNLYLPDEYIFSERHTGSDEDRPEYLRCEQFIQEIKPQAFLVHNTDRMARNFGHTLVIAQKLRKQGCQLISATQHFDSTTREGQLMITVLGWMAESERESIRERMMRGKRAKLASGQHTEQGKPKYGYRYVDGDRLRDPITSRVVLEMYNWAALEGLSAHAVTRRLNESRSLYPSPADYNGIVFQDDRPTPGWHVATVLNILKDPTYLGKSFTNRYRTLEGVKGRKGRWAQEKVSAAEWVEIKGAITEQIVTQELFDAVQQALKDNIKGTATTRNRRRPYLLRGMIFCAKCGCKMSPSQDGTNAKWKRSYQVYRCNFRAVVSREVKCSRGRVRADMVEELVVRRVLDHLREPEEIMRWYDGLRCKREDVRLRNELSIVESSIEETSTALSNLTIKLTKYIEQGNSLADTLEEATARKKIEFDKLQEYREHIESQLRVFTEMDKQMDRVFEICGRIARGMVYEQMSWEEKRALLCALDVAVYAHKEVPGRIEFSLGTNITLDEANTSLSLDREQQYSEVLGVSLPSKR